MDKNSTTQQNALTRLMSMDDAVWSRHANPWSVWTRVVTGLPLMLGAVWSIEPMGKWSIANIGFVAFWIWLNPRLFSIPEKTDNWASKVTFGERIWLNRKELEIPKHHSSWALTLSITTGLGFFVALYGAFQNLLLPTLLGGVISWIGKMWFCDRMVWLYHDMLDSAPEFRNWLK